MTYLPHHRNKIRLDLLETFAAVVALLILAAFMGRCFVDAMVLTADNQLRYYSAPSQEAVLSAMSQQSGPMRYRVTAPTHEQLWVLDHHTEVARVAHAERNGGGM